MRAFGFWMRSSIAKQEVPIIGFCFSFPVEQSSVDSGKLLRWTKGYTNPGAVGNDPAKLLSDAFKRRVSLDHLSDMMWFLTFIVDQKCGMETLFWECLSDLSTLESCCAW